MIDPKTLKELVRLMVQNDLTELDIQDQGERVTLKRAGQAAPQLTHVPAPVYQAAPSPPAPQPAAASSKAPVDENAGLVPIPSPMVGTFYGSPNPDAKPFVTEGAKVTPDTVVCIIEAMKVFNEIKAEVSGTIAKVLVTNGQAVEFGQPLYMIKP